MQLIIYLLAVTTCEMIGLQARNTFCQLYFSIDVEDPRKVSNKTRGKRWCIIWNDIQNAGQGIRCTRAESMFRLNKEAAAAARSAKAMAKKKKKIATSAPPVQTEPPVPPMIEVNLDIIRPLLPHIELKAKSLQPKLWIKRNRQPVDFVMTLSIYKLLDSNDQRLFSTLDTLFSSIPPSEQHKCLVMVFITEILDDSYAENLISNILRRYNVQVDTGLMEILAPRDNFYISMFKPKTNKNKNLSDEKKKISRFRRKQCMDHIFMMLLAHQRGKYYLQLSHDVITRKDFLPAIKQALSKHFSRNWVVLRFASAGIIGKLMHTSDLVEICKYLSRLDMNKPADSHIASFVQTKKCPKEKDSFQSSSTCKASLPSIRADSVLFRYMTRDISIHAKKKNNSNQKDAAKEQNSSAWVESSFTSTYLKEHMRCTTIRVTQNILPLLVSGASLVSVQGRARQERIDISFNPPLNIYRLKLVTGLPGDQRYSLGEDTTVWAYSNNQKKFTHVGNLSQRGDLETSLVHDLLPVQVLEINLGIRHQDQEVFLNALKLTITCRQNTRLYLSTTAEMKPTELPSWYVSPPKHLPRKEEGVLISF
ncbi:hypothetical protein RRG08_040137 [Elysia crispata]|uniref:MGAT4 conserved region domain-containing protein n=1 Tax=Elysia crispata TaxID=231223 RepID=A0AAE0XWI3_9GAST|nr:hypothetical protein RRG08_040137 [Elysia crispata]